MEEARCCGVNADDDQRSFKASPCRDGGATTASADAECNLYSADTDLFQARVSFTQRRNDGREQSDPPELRIGVGSYWSPYGEVFFKEGHDEGWRNYAVGF